MDVITFLAVLNGTNVLSGLIEEEEEAKEGQVCVCVCAC